VQAWNRIFAYEVFCVEGQEKTVQKADAPCKHSKLSQQTAYQHFITN